MADFFDQALAFAREMAIYFAFFAALAITLKREKVWDAVLRTYREARTNLGLAVFNKFVTTPLFLVVFIALEQSFRGFGLLTEFWDASPQAPTLIAAILLIDFAAYWRHRLEHSAPVWRFHATHHADEAIHWLTVHRKHPVGRLLSMLFDTSLVLLLGLPAWSIVAALLLRSMWGHFIHADVPWTLGPIGKVMMSPAAHRLHHIRDEELMGSNYANTVTVWDKLFGTYVDPAPYVDCETGIAEGTRGFLGELIRPWEDRYRQPAKNADTEAVSAGS